MNKREMIHAVIDKLLDVEEMGTAKKLAFYYHQNIGLDFNFREGNGSDKYVGGRGISIYSGEGWSIEEGVKIAFEFIETVKNTPDVKPQISITISEEEAREKGLIA